MEDKVVLSLISAQVYLNVKINNHHIYKLNMSVFQVKNELILKEISFYNFDFLQSIVGLPF
jgi:hypothetical protein